VGYAGSVIVVSYNILADSYIKPAFYPNAKAEHLEPTWRRSALIERIASLDADVICLQEVEEAVFGQVQSRLTGFEAHYAKKSQGKPDGCATFVRGGTVARRTLAYSDGSGHVALIVAVDLAGVRVGISNTHFKWGPPGTSVGADQAIELLAALDADGWIACGDFNAGPESALVAEFHRRGFADSHAALGGHTCNSNGVPKRIDFLMHRGLKAVPSPLAFLEGATPLPSAAEPSDHLAIRATFSRP